MRTPKDLYCYVAMLFSLVLIIARATELREYHGHAMRAYSNGAQVLSFVSKGNVRQYLVFPDPAWGAIHCAFVKKTMETRGASALAAHGVTITCGRFNEASL